MFFQAMDLPGSSLFNGGSLHFDGLAMGPGTSGGAEEEAEAAEEEERRNQEVTNLWSLDVLQTVWSSFNPRPTGVFL